MTLLSLGTKLLNLRHQNKLSQTEIADILGISQNAYNKWEADKCKPSANNLLKLSQYYKVDIIKLIDDNEKVSLSNNELKDKNKYYSTVNIKSPISLMEQMLQMQKQILKLLEIHFCLIEELLKNK